MESASHPTPFKLQKRATLVARDLTRGFGDFFSAAKALLQAQEGQSRSSPGLNAEEGMAILGGERQGKCRRGSFGGWQRKKETGRGTKLEQRIGFAEQS